METKKPVRRSQAWFGKNDRDGFVHRSWIKNQGYPHDELDGRPVIGICNTWSELTPCNGHFRELAEFVKRGVYEAGGFPLEFPVMSLGETQLRPTAMLFRNLASMDVEESIRGNPIDGVVLLMGCDKTTPALMMGAASCNLPTIGLSGGPMLNGKFRGQDIGSGTGVWKMSEMVRAGEMTQEDFTAAESCMHRSKGNCMTMGTASTMASMVEALGMSLPENAAIPAADTRRNRLAQMTGRRIVEMVKDDLTMTKILTRHAFENAIRTNAAIGGSTNAVIHLLAIAGRIGIDLKLGDWDELGRQVPCLLDLQPSGKFLMEDFYYAGGLPAILREIQHLLQHRGRAVVFETIEDFHARIDDEALDIDEHCVMVLKNCGPRGYPGMAEVGNMPLPPKVLRKGITDMVRISDARMSGTAYGTVVLHTSPEAAAGGPLALVQNGDMIELDVPARTLRLEVGDEELARRRALWKPLDAPKRGWQKLYVEHVQQAHLGADLDFLVGASGAGIPRDSH